MAFKFERNPHPIALELLIKEVDMLIKGAEEKYARMVNDGHMKKESANFKWNALVQIKEKLQDVAGGQQANLFTPPQADSPRSGYDPKYGPR